MRKIDYRELRLWLLFLLLLPSCMGRAVNRVTSPDGSLILTTGLRNGQPYYQLDCGNRHVVLPSSLGFTLNDGDFSRGFRLIGTERATKDETWNEPWGEEAHVRNHYNELTLKLQERKGNRRRMDIVFRVFDDGIGFRYVFPQQKDLGKFQIMEELTQFALPWDAQAWTIPTNGTKYYEALWTVSALSKKDTVSTPVTIEAPDSLYLAIHEANLTDYASLNLTPRHTNGAAVTLTAALTPWQNGVKVYAQTPFVSPWRTIIVAHKPGDLITSRLMLNLNESCKIADTSWLKTGKYVGIWWGMHMLDYTWHQGPKHGATTTNTRRYIDFAARHGFDGVLVEGWNWGWDGDWTTDGDKFSFTKPYPDYDLKGLQQYAVSKGVSLVAHNETGGAAKNYENQLDSAFALYERLGIHCVKTGYVNPMLDNKELQHSQYGIRHYRKVIETAAKHHIMIINHEPAMPTGLQRTWPNLISGEGMRGQEYNAWSSDGGNPPYHICILPFTRGLAGPMDFTPGIFNFHNKAYPKTHPQTTLAKQLAEYVVIYAPWQMAADEIENYEDNPALAFVEAMPTNWEETRILNASIGHYLTTARKDRDSDRWVIGSVTDEQPRDLTLTLDFIDEGAKYKAFIYEDGEGADYRTNPYPLSIRTLTLKHGDKIQLHLAPSGGAAIILKKTED